MHLAPGDARFPLQAGTLLRQAVLDDVLDRTDLDQVGRWLDFRFDRLSAHSVVKFPNFRYLAAISD
jgi:hypothetical protein